MKKNHTLLISGIVVTFIVTMMIACSSGTKYTGVSAQAALRAAIEGGRWTFVPTFVMPSFSRSRPVNAYYSAVKMGDTLNVGLPYFGRANSASAGFDAGNVMNFISKDFIYNITKSGEEKWEVQIITKDYREVSSMRFTFFSDGNATLDVSFGNRSSISYRGEVLITKKI